MPSITWPARSSACNRFLFRCISTRSRVIFLSAWLRWLRDNYPRTSKPWSNSPRIPPMSTGATDGKYSRIAGIPTYGVSCMFFDKHDDRSHGKDERVGVQDFYDGLAFNYKLIRELATPH